jgi:hypothetical protein
MFHTNVCLFQQTTRRYLPECITHKNRYCENLKSKTTIISPNYHRICYVVGIVTCWLVGTRHK